MFDYEVSSFPDTPPSEMEDKEPEMQERGVGSGGSAILGHGSVSGSGRVRCSTQPSGSMENIREEVGDDGEGGSSRCEHGPEKIEVEFNMPPSHTA